MQGVSLIVFATAVVCTLAAPHLPYENRVLGGENALQGEFPWMASLRRSTGGHFCGGSIISESVILTAAHCVVGTAPSSISVVTGSTTLNSGGNSHAVSQIITHADYNSADSWRNDVAIIKLASPIVLTDLEKIVTLPSQGEDDGDENSAPSRVSGWGYTTYPGFVLPNNLQKVDLALVPHDTCNNAHTINVYVTQICAGTIRGQGVCNGDSGGPLVANGKQVGIVSWGQSCATGIADVYTRVSAYADWIQSNSA